MKLAFSTLGCPDWSLEQICKYGKKYGFAGVGIRGISGEFDLTRIEAFSEENREETLEKFKKYNLNIAILSSSVRFNSPEKKERQAHLKQGKRVVDLAAELGVDKIRVFGGSIPEGINRKEAHQWVMENLKQLGEYAGRKKVYIALETHDDYTDTYLVKDIIEKVDNEYVKVLWDVHHPYRLCEEKIEESWQNIGDYVVHTHFKDSYLDDSEEEGYKYCLLGEGEIPNQKALQLLKENDYKGYLSLEWEKAWHSYLPGPHNAFPQYSEKMQEYLQEIEE